MFNEGELAAGRYIVQAKLADGHLGPIFRAVDVQSRNAVVVRPISLPPNGDEALERDLREIAGLGHPNIASSELRYTDDHQPFLASELVDGKSLDALIRDEAPLALPRACSIARQIAAALDAGHHAGIVHGDLKPSSVLVTGDPNEEKVKVCGLGTYSLKSGSFISLVRLAMPRDGASLFGLPEYIAPEQALGTSADALDGRSDLYALGVILYQMLTGAVPHAGATPVDTLLAKIFSPPSPFSSQLEIPLVVQTLVTRSLAKRRDERPASATVIADQLAAWEQKKVAPAAVVPLQPEPAHPLDAETGEAAQAQETILASTQAGRFAEEPPPAQSGWAESPPELPGRDGAEFVPDLQPTVAFNSRSGASPTPPPAPDEAIDLDLAGAAAGPVLSRGLEPDFEPVAAAIEPQPPANEPSGGAGLDVRLDAPGAAAATGRDAASSPPQPFFRPTADGATIFRGFQQRPKQQGIGALSVAAIVILIILASGCGFLYYTGRSYWFNPSYVRMRISTFFAGSSSTPQVQTDAYSQSAAPAVQTPKPVSSASHAPSAGTSTVTTPAAPAPQSASSSQSGGQASGASLAAGGTLAQAAVPNPTQAAVPNSGLVTSPVRTRALPAKPGAEHARPHPAVRRSSLRAKTAQNVAGDVEAAVTRGDYYFDHGDYDAAIRAYEDGLAHAPGNQQLDSEIARARKAQAAEAKYLQ